MCVSVVCTFLLLWYGCTNLFKCSFIGEHLSCFKFSFITNKIVETCVQNLMNRGAWWATVHSIAKSWMWLKGLNTHTSCFVRSLTPFPRNVYLLLHHLFKRLYFLQYYFCTFMKIQLNVFVWVNFWIFLICSIVLCVHTSSSTMQSCLLKLYNAPWNWVGQFLPLYSFYKLF